MAVNLFGFFALAILIWCYFKSRPGWLHSGPYLPDALLLGIMLYTCGAGIVALTDPYYTRAATVITNMGIAAATSALVGATAFSALTRSDYVKLDFVRIHADTNGYLFDRRILSWGMALCVLVVFGFIYAIITNPVLGKMFEPENLFSTPALAYARNAMTFGTVGYFAPGYVKQVRDILLPVMLCAIILVYENPFRRIWLWVTCLAAVAGMLVSGQREPIVIMFLMMGIGSYYRDRIRHLNAPAHRINLAVYAIIGLLILGMWAGMSALLGRSQDPGASFNPIASLAERVMLIWPRENARTYAVWSVAGPTDGDSWSADMASIGGKPRDPSTYNLAHLSNVLSVDTGASLAGNSPLGLPPDLYVAWGWSGIFIVPAIYAILLGLLDMVFLSESSPLFFAMKLMCFLMLPVCASPYLMLLYGPATCLALSILLKLGRFLFSSPSPTVLEMRA